MIKFLAEVICDRCQQQQMPTHCALVGSQIQIVPPPGWKPQRSGQMYCTRCADAGDLVPIRPDSNGLIVPGA